MFCCIFISVLSSFAVNAERRPTKTLSDERLGKAALGNLLGELDNVHIEKPFGLYRLLKQRVTMPSRVAAALRSTAISAPPLNPYVWLTDHRSYFSSRLTIHLGGILCRP
jgi:hypothetical protein